jgi:isocitrate/isopropylmalate dehydrogenase
MKKWIDKGLENVALSTRIMSKQGCTNICKQAFEFAKKTGRKRVTLIEKPNVLRETGGLMMRCFKEVAKNYPDIRADDANIDGSACGCSRIRRIIPCSSRKTCSATS